MKVSKLNVDRATKLILKKFQKSFSKEQIADMDSEAWAFMIKSYRQQHLNDGLPMKDAQGFAVADCLSIRSLILKKYHSFYVLDNSVVDFVKSTKLNPKEMKQIHDVVYGIISDYRKHGFVVHMAGEEQSILYTFSPNDVLFNDESLDPKKTQKGIGVYYKSFCKGEAADIGFSAISKDNGLIGGEVLSNETGAKQWRIFFNICLYISAFPEYVKDGAPPIKIEGSRSNSLTIRASSQMKEVYREGVSPHMRRGHFRFLRSDRYKNKRFQAVYVKPTMVSGKASTVTEGETP